MPALQDQADIVAENEQLRARVCALEGRRHDPASHHLPVSSAEWEARNPRTGATQAGPVASVPGTPATSAAKPGQNLTDLCRASVKTPAPVPHHQASPTPGQALSLTDQCLAARR